MKHKNPGNFANNKKRASEAGKRGGAVSPGNFKYNPERASLAGKRGGKARASR
jgi:general stress protein YciG